MNFKDKVVYQIYPKSYCDSNDDGWGDLKGILSKLDYLKKLGVDYIWLDPIFPSPQRDNGYDVADYREIDPRYGTMEEFEELCREAKKRGIEIMLDMVFNHTSTEHVWFKRALKNEKKYKDYYIFKKGKENGRPNNWQSKFGGPAWEYVPELGEYYLHLYDVTQADLNWENPDVRKEAAEIVNFWRSKGVRAFRFDVINLISKAGFEDDPNVFDGRQFYTDGPKVHDYIRELNENSFGQEDCMTVGEMSSTTVENCIEYSGKDRHELSSVHTFHHLKVDYKDKQKWELKPFDFMELKQILNEYQTRLQEHDAWNALFWTNHDQPRALSRFGDDKNYPLESGKMLASAIHCMRGTPYIYMGEEIGMTNHYFTDIHQYRDVESINFFHILKEQGKSEEEIYHILQARSRDNTRTPMQWDDSLYAGFGSHEPWIPVIENYKTVNAKAALEDPDSLFYHYQKLIRLRKEYRVIQEGSYVPLLEDHPSIFAYKRVLDSETLLVINNFYGNHAETEVEDIKDYVLLLSNYDDFALKNTIQLRPYESLVLYKKSFFDRL